jgi:opacity protein-like surface antigen
MKAILVRATSIACCLLALATAASAQEAADSTGRARRSTVHLVPSITGTGISIAGRDEHAVSAGGASRAYGLAVEVATPLRGVDLRVGVSRTRTVLHADRDPDGPREVGIVSFNSVTLDAVARGPRLLDFRPYAVLGIGYRYYDFTDQNYMTLSRNQGRFPLHVGAGLAWDVGRYELTLEGGHYYNKLNDIELLQGGDVNDNTLTVGLRLPIN